jgi:hypothetical protein
MRATVARAMATMLAERGCPSLAAAGRGNKGADGAPGHKEDIRAAFAAAQDLLLGVVSAPEALSIQGVNIVVRQAAEERDVPQRFQLPHHDTLFLSGNGEMVRRLLAVSRSGSHSRHAMFMGIAAYPFKGDAVTPVPDDLRVF